MGARTKENLQKLQIARDEFILTRDIYTSANSIALKYGFSNAVFTGFLKSEGIYSGKIPPVDENLFEKIDNHEKAYWLGWLYSDGNVFKKKKFDNYRISLEICKEDAHQVEKFRLFLKGVRPITFRRNTATFAFGSSKMGYDLVKLGCIPAKSLILEFPTEEQVPREFIYSFIRGYFEGDGSITYSKKFNMYNIAMLGTEQFLTGLMKNFDFFNRKLVNINSKGNNSFNLRLDYSNAEIFLDKIYENASIILERKYNVYLDLKNHLNNRSDRDNRRFSKTGHGVPIICENDQKTFLSLREAARYYNTKDYMIKTYIEKGKLLNGLKFNFVTILS